jgi:hypothetical protein
MTEARRNITHPYRRRLLQVRRRLHIFPRAARPTSHVRVAPTALPHCGTVAPAVALRQHPPSAQRPAPTLTTLPLTTSPSLSAPNAPETADYRPKTARRHRNSAPRRCLWQLTGGCVHTYAPMTYRNIVHHRRRSAVLQYSKYRRSAFIPARSNLPVHRDPTVVNWGMRMGIQFRSRFNVYTGTHRARGMGGSTCSNVRCTSRILLL